MKTIVELIRLIAEEKGTNISEMERELEIANGTIRRWDKSSPSIKNVLKVADKLNVSVDYLLGRTPIIEVLSSDKITDNSGASVILTEASLDKLPLTVLVEILSLASSELKKRIN